MGFKKIAKRITKKVVRSKTIKAEVKTFLNENVSVDNLELLTSSEAAAQGGGV